MPHTRDAIPTITWGDLEVAYDDLAITPAEKEAVHQLVTITRLLSPNLSPLDLMREIICIAFVLTPASDLESRPPTWLPGARRLSG